MLDRSGQSVCLCMIVKDEAPVIRACLESVRPLINHWIIVDTGSTDGTQTIIRETLAGVPGTLHERPWRDFAHNRSEALALARDCGTYSLIIDADDTLDIPKGYRLPGLVADSYTIDISFGSSLYRRPQFVRAALPWRYEGVIHEYLECEAAQTKGHLPSLVMRIGQGGARRRDPETYRRDALVLERALTQATTPLLASRYTFYLAQSYRDGGEIEKAIALYLRRADLGCWHEEVYCSLLEAGRLMQRAGRPLDEVLVPLERAMAVVPSRAEALHAASHACRMHGDSRRGTGYGKYAAGTPIPEHGLFLERWIYEYGGLDEYAINAYWNGDYRDSLDACLRALASGKVPEDQRERFLANARFALDKLAVGGMAVSTARETAAHALAAPRALHVHVPTPAPRVLLSILAKQKESVLPLFLECIEALDYPKSSIVLYVRTNNNTDRTKDLLEAWLDRVRGDYAGVEYDGINVETPVEQFGVHEWNVTRFRVLNHIRDVSLSRTAAHGCAYYFTTDCDNFVRPCTLRILVATNLPIVAPLLRHIDPGRLYSNYHSAIDDAGYFKDDDTYQPILFRHLTGLIELPVVHCTYLVRADVIPKLGYNDGSDDYDYVIFSRRARAAGIAQYFDNRQVYGYITLDDHEPDLIVEQLRRARRLLSADRGIEDRLKASLQP